jgi:hypothetical protein
MGQSNGKPDSGAVTERTKVSAREKLGERRTSFYETVDASEILPYLIIGKL